MSNPRCFISYSWDNLAHKSWVRELAEKLQANGVEVFLDQWDLKPGGDLLLYMEQSVSNSDYVLLVCTSIFTQKANSGEGGVGYEKMIITGEIFHRVSNNTKFVPLLRSGTPGSSLPSYLKSKVFIDFRDSAKFTSSLEELLRHIHISPHFVRPPVGKKPFFDSATRIKQSSYIQQQGQVIHYCLRCGATTGNSSECTGAYSHHSFVNGQGNEYCLRCGATTGNPSECTGAYTHHSFVPS